MGWAFLSVEACVFYLSPSTELPLLLSFEVTEQLRCHRKCRWQLGQIVMLCKQKETNQHI